MGVNENRPLIALDCAGMEIFPSAQKNFGAYELDLARPEHSTSITKQNIQAIEGIRKRILVPFPKHTAQKTEPYAGTCQALLDQISGTVHRTIDDLDYNGLTPYTKLMDQLEEGKTFGECEIDSRNEEPGGTCVGMSLSILKNLKKEYGIEGQFAVQRKSCKDHFEHGAVIIECTDGFVLIDARSDPEARMFSIPFNSTIDFKHFSITASKKGAVAPLTMSYHGDKNHFEYWIHVTNGDDIVMKHYMISRVSQFTPIVVYKNDGSPFKDIKIFPSQGKIILKNHITKKEDSITFESIRNGDLLTKLEEFMGSDFHSFPKDVHDQIHKFASQEERIKKIYQKMPLNKW